MRGWAIALVIFITAGLGNYLFFFTNRDVETIDLKQIFPYKVDGWVGRDLALKDYVYKILGSRNVLSRRYDRAGETLVLSVVVSDKDRRVVHPPDVCLKGGGANVMDKRVITISNIGKVNELVLKGAPEPEIVWYVYALGNKFYTNYYLYQLENLKQAFLGKPSHSYLIRLEFSESVRSDAKKFFSLLLSKVRHRL